MIVAEPVARPLSIGVSPFLYLTYWKPPINTSDIAMRSYALDTFTTVLVGGCRRAGKRASGGTWRSLTPSKPSSSVTVPIQKKYKEIIAL